MRVNLKRIVGLKLTKIRVINQENADNFFQVKTNDKPAETCRRWDPMRTFQNSFLSYLNRKMLLCFADRSSLLRKQCFQFCYRFIVEACRCCSVVISSVPEKVHPFDFRRSVSSHVIRSSLLRKQSFQVCSRRLEGCVVNCYCCIFSQTLLFR